MFSEQNARDEPAENEPKPEAEVEVRSPAGAVAEVEWLAYVDCDSNARLCRFRHCYGRQSHQTTQSILLVSYRGTQVVF